MQEWVHVTRPDGDGPFPVIVFFHHGPGFDAGSKQAAQLLADAGFYVAAIDRYHRFEPWASFDLSKMRDAESPERDRMMKLLFGTSDDDVETDVAALLADLRDDPTARDDRMGVIGYCIGGRSVLKTMTNHPDLFLAGVALHPSFAVTDDADSPHRAVASLPGHLYVAMGGADQLSSVESNQPLTDAVGELGDRGTVEIHDGADHGFAVFGSPAYQEAAAARSYEQALALFGKVLS